MCKTKNKNKYSHLYKPKITVYITNYNYGKYLAQSIQSVLNQTYKNFELIIIDDGSIDNSYQIIESFYDKKIVHKIFNKNIGLNKSSNLAIKKATGDYIIRLDADDYFEKNALFEFIKHIKKNPLSSLIFPDYFHVNKKGKKICRIKRENFSKKVKMLDLPAHGACTLFKVSTIKKIGGYDKDFDCQDGYDIWLKIINKYQITNINKPLFNYRQHSSNLTKNEERILLTRAKIINKRVKKLKLNKKDTLAIIPVRKKYSSNDIDPNAKIGDKSLVELAINYSKKSKYVAHTILATNDKSLFYLKKQKKVSIEKRNDEEVYLPLDNLIEKILRKKIYRKYKNLIILFVETPFRNEVYIDKAINSLRLFGSHLIECVKHEQRLIYYHDGSGLKLLKPNNFLKVERDNIYIRVGGMIVINLKEYLKRKKIYSLKKVGHILIDQKSSFHLSSKLDLKIAQKIKNL